MEYSGVKEGKVASVLAMEVSTVDGGAVLDPFSQYPAEEETLWNACSYLENVQGALLLLCVYSNYNSYDNDCDYGYCLFYRVTRMHRVPYLYRSFSAKEPYNWWLFCGRKPAT